MTKEEKLALTRGFGCLFILLAVIHLCILVLGGWTAFTVSVAFTIVVAVISVVAISVTYGW